MQRRNSGGENMENMKGIIFSFDAILGAALVVILISGIVLLQDTEPNKPIEQAILYTKAADGALVNFYLNITDSFNENKPAVNCKRIEAYGNNGSLTSIPEAAKCEQ